MENMENIGSDFLLMLVILGIVAFILTRKKG